MKNSILRTILCKNQNSVSTHSQRFSSYLVFLNPLMNKDPKQSLTVALGIGCHGNKAKDKIMAILSYFEHKL